MASVKELNVVVEALQAQVAALVAAHNELEQRTLNFAARTTANGKLYRAEITRLREQVEALTPKAPVQTTDRLARKDFDAALAELKRLTGIGFHSPSAVRGMWLKMQSASADKVEVPAEAEEEDEMTL